MLMFNKRYRNFGYDLNVYVEFDANDINKQEHHVGFQPSVLALVVGEADAKHFFRTQLYEGSNTKTGPVPIVYGELDENNQEIMLVRMDSEGGDSYSKWSYRIHLFVHVIDPEVTDPSVFYKRYKSITHRSPSNAVHVIYFISPSMSELESFQILFHSLSIQKIYDSITTPSVQSMLINAAVYFKTNCEFQSKPVPFCNVENRYVKEYNDEFPSYSDVPPLWQGYMEVLRPSQLARAITAHSYDILRNTLLALSQDPRYLWDYEERDFLMYLHQAAELKLWPIVQLFYAFLPDLGIQMMQPTPVDFVRGKRVRGEAQLNEYKVNWSPSPRDEYILSHYQPESMRQGTFIPEEPYSDSPPFFVSPNQYQYTLKDEYVFSYVRIIQKITVFLEWLIQRNHFKLNPDPGQRIDRRWAHFRLIEGLTEPYEVHNISNKKVNPLHFQRSMAYEKLKEAVDTNNANLAQKCLAIFRLNRIPLAEVLNYSEPVVIGDKIQSAYFSAFLYNKTKSILDRLFDTNSLSLLKVLCLDQDTLLLVQEYIRSRRLISNKLGTQSASSVQLLMTLLVNPEQARTMMDSVTTLAAIGFSDLFLTSNTMIYQDQVMHYLDIMFKSIFRYAPNLKRIAANPGMRQAIADFFRQNLPQSGMLNELYLPLAEAQQRLMVKELGALEQCPGSLSLQAMNLPGVKYLFGTLSLERIYTLYSRKSGRPFFLKLFPHGIITSAANREELDCRQVVRQKKTVPVKEVPEASHGVVMYSGKKEHLKYPTGTLLEISSPLAAGVGFFKDALKYSIPKCPSQTPNILSSDSRRYIPVSVGQYQLTSGYQEHGFWGSYKSYGSNPQNRPERNFQAAVTGACMVGIALYGQMLNEAGEVIQSIHLTHPDERIPTGFRIDRIYSPFKEHVYERYTAAQMNETLPFIIKALQKKAPVYYDLPTANYIMYGIKYWLCTLFNEEQFTEYVRIISEHDVMIRQWLQRLEEKFSVRIIPCSTLNDLGLAHRSGKEIIASISEILPQEVQSSSYHIKASCLVEHMLNVLTSQPGSIGDIYRHISLNSLLQNADPLLALSRMDYAALYAFVKLECATQNQANPSEQDVMGFMPQDEVHIFQAYAKHFSKHYGNLDAIDWIPMLMPQNKGAKSSKLFYVEDGVDELNALIDQGLVHLQSLLVGAIKNNNPQQYLSVLQDIIKCLSHASTPSNLEIGV